VDRLLSLAGGVGGLRFLPISVRAYALDLPPLRRGRSIQETSSAFVVPEVQRGWKRFGPHRHEWLKPVLASGPFRALGLSLGTEDNGGGKTDRNAGKAPVCL
jgi:hypothetical protein